VAVTVQQLLDQVVQEGGLDATQTQALRWLNARHQSMCARSRCFVETTSQAAVAGQSDYLAPVSAIEIMAVVVDGVPYGRAGWNDLQPGRTAFLTLSGDGGVASPQEGTFGERMVRVFPTPDAAGVLQIHAAMLPADLDPANDSSLKVDADMGDALVSGALATALLRVENRPDLAASHEAIFSSACEELRRRVQRRYRGTGPARIRVNFRG
jgi:hypothetical protein